MMETFKVLTNGSKMVARIHQLKSVTEWRIRRHSTHLTRRPGRILRIECHGRSWCAPPPPPPPLAAFSTLALRRRTALPTSAKIVAIHASIMISTRIDQRLWRLCEAISCCGCSKRGAPHVMWPQVDPVHCSDGWTYCRFSAFQIIDSGQPMPGCRNGKFEILGPVTSSPPFPASRACVTPTCTPPTCNINKDCKTGVV